MISETPEHKEEYIRIHTYIHTNVYMSEELYYKI